MRISYKISAIFQFETNHSEHRLNFYNFFWGRGIRFQRKKKKEYRISFPLIGSFVSILVNVNYEKIFYRFLIVTFFVIQSTSVT